MKRSNKRLVSLSLLTVLGTSLFAYSASADELVIPNAFSAGTAAVADEVNANFDAVVASVNDNNARMTAVEGTASMTDVFTFFLPDEVTRAAGDTVGSAELQRAAMGLKLTVDTTMLTAGNAYTLWWIIFNNPAACDPAGCSDADFGTAEVEASVLNATGRVVGADGNGTFNAFLPVGFMHTNTPSGNIRHAFGPGLQNVAGAEVHVVIRSHGPWSGNIEQISSLMADCNTGAGPSGCFDAQAMKFPLPMP